LPEFFVQDTPKPSAAEVEQAKEWLKPVWSSLGWTELPTPAKWCEDFSAQFETLIELRPAVASFTLASSAWSKSSVCMRPAFL
jgi:nitronate monooxygenase